MVDLTAEMTELWNRIGPPPAGRCKALQFVSAATGEGTSTVAREFARVAAAQSTRPVWLVDMDLWSGVQVAAIGREPARYGELGPETTGAPENQTFFAIEPPSRDPDGRELSSARYLHAHGVGGRKFWVTRFRPDGIEQHQSVEIVREAGYWDALRKHAEIIVVDAPAADRSEAALVIAPLVDATVLVVAADQGNARAPGALRDGIVASGGRCAGLVFNRARVEPPRFLKALLS
jgi:Mrp family chromosome partitioning ATPase